MTTIRTGTWALLGAMLIAGGCTQKPAPPPPPSAELRAQLGRIGAIANPGSGAIELVTPTKGAGEGALSGAGQGALGMIGGGFSSGQPAGLVLGIALAPVAAIVGAVVGASSAHGEAEVVAAEKAIRATMASVRPSKTLRDRIVSVTRRDTHVDIVALPDHDGRIGYRALAGEKDSVLLISVERYGFQARGKISPDLRLHIGATARLVRVSDGRTLYQRSWVHAGPWRNYFDWARDDAALLRASLERAFDGMGRDMASVLFVQIGAPNTMSTPRRRAPPSSEKGSSRCPDGVVVSYC